MLNLVDSPAVVVEKPKQNTMLPVLVVLFLVSYGLMTMLIVEQARTIDTQRSLIRQLFSDSAQLTAMKGAAQRQNSQKAHPPSSNPPSQSSPAERSKPGRTTMNKSAGKLRQMAPLKPPKAAADTPDERRNMSTI